MSRISLCAFLDAFMTDGWDGSGEDTSPDFIAGAASAAPLRDVIFFTFTCGAFQQTQWRHITGEAGQIVSDEVGHGDIVWGAGRWDVRW